MVNAEESDPDAVADVISTIGDDVISALSRAAAEHSVTISLYISPTVDDVDDATSDA